MNAPFVVDREKIADFISIGLQKNHFTAQNVIRVVFSLDRLNSYVKHHQRAVEMYGIFLRIKTMMTKLSDEEKSIFIRILRDTYYEEMRSPMFRSLQ